ncbi:MAG TPA: ribosome-binding factor A, partial [Candidatus Yonathbacteria bacterium]|nr:ribosome-binding factor A [Candidatus Yonathbacteria bacterium]
MTQRQEKVAGVIKKLAAQFLQIESSGQSLITVTNCTISPDLRKATIFISVLPEKSEEFALQFIRRKRSEMRDYLKKNTKMRVLPFLDVELDYGEKNRQRIDEL